MRANIFEFNGIYAFSGRRSVDSEAPVVTKIPSHLFSLLLYSLPENGPKVQAKGTSYCCSRYCCNIPAATVAGTFGLDWAQGRDIGAGSWHDPAPILEHRDRVVLPTDTK